MAAFEVLNRQIVSEIIDGEAVILDLRSGRYHRSEERRVGKECRL